MEVVEALTLLKATPLDFVCPKGSISIDHARGKRESLLDRGRGAPVPAAVRMDAVVGERLFFGSDADELVEIDEGVPALRRGLRHRVDVESKILVMSRRVGQRRAEIFVLDR